MDGQLNAQPVYRELAQYQQSQDWKWRDLAVELHRWVEIFNFEFNLQLPEVSLCVDSLRRSRYGQFRYGHNGFGLRDEILLNTKHLGSREPWQLLGTLLHEMLHSWQQAYGRAGKRNYHNAEFRKMALEYGLIVDSRGCTEYERESKFTDLLRKHGVNVPAIPKPEERQPGVSKLKKWSCSCTNVRVAVADFQAQCIRCGEVFVLRE